MTKKKEKKIGNRMEEGSKRADEIDRKEIRRTKGIEHEKAKI